MKNRFTRIISPLYVFNMAVQSIVSLLSPIAVAFLIAYLLEKYCAVGSWIYVPFMILGLFSGLYSMVVFILRASQALEALEKQHSQKGETDKL